MLRDADSLAQSHRVRSGLKHALTVPPCLWGNGRLRRRVLERRTHGNAPSAWGPSVQARVEQRLILSSKP
jgi:hypothetical protein